MTERTHGRRILHIGRKHGSTHREALSQGSLRLMLGSTRMIMQLFWLTVVAGALIFVLPGTARINTPAFIAFVNVSVIVFLATRFFPYNGYHPALYIFLLMTTNGLIALLVYFTGGSFSNLSLLYLAVVIFASAYLEALATFAVTVLTASFYFAPLIYEQVPWSRLRDMAISVPVFLLVALCGSVLIKKAREQKEAKEQFADLYQETDIKHRELQAFYGYSLKLAGAFELDDIAQILLEHAGSLIPADQITLALLDQEGNNESILTWHSELPSLLDNETRNTGNPLLLAASAVLPVLVTAPDEDRRFSAFFESRPQFGSLLAVPLFASANAVGVLGAASKHRKAFDDHHAQLLLTLASQAALALEKARLYRTTRQDMAKIEGILNSLTDGLIVVDAEMKLVLANPSFRRFTGLEESDYGISLADVFSRPDLSIKPAHISLDDVRERVLEEGTTLADEALIGRDGEELCVHLYCVPLKQDDAIVGAVMLAHDITEFKKLDAMKSHIISVVSHELKTPLTSIRGFASLLLAERFGALSPKQRHYLTIVEDQAENLTELINSLLDLSKIESGMLKLQKEPIDVRELIYSCLAQFNDLAGDKHVDISVNVTEHLPELFGDRRYISQIICNLVGNALKFSDKPGSIRIAAKRRGEFCLLSVADQGLGISPSDLKRIFDKFYQADSSSSRLKSGSGLGLTITREFVRAHGGDIWVKSKEGTGSTFYLTLPLVSGPREASENHPDQSLRGSLAR